MNESVLFSYFAHQLHTHVRIFDRDRQLAQTYTKRHDLPDLFINSPEMMSALLDASLAGPCLCDVNQLLSYMTVPVEGKFCVIGPVGVCSDCYTKHRIPTLVIPNELVQNLYPIDSRSMLQMGVFLYNLFAGSPVDLLDCYNQNCAKSDVAAEAMRQATKFLFRHEEYGEKHNPYEQEMREMNSIEKGDLAQLKESWEEDFSGAFGILSNDPLTHAKFLSVTNVALSTRAAIRGGLPYELAFSLSDAYCQQIDSLTMDQMFSLEGLVRNIQLTYTKLVAQQKGNSSDSPKEEYPMVVRAKDYIFSHLHGKLTLNDVANAIHTHPGYLNRIFKQSEKITIHDYILREKINLARNMLTYSDYSYLEIANYLGFSSQSHLGIVFKKFTQMTLKQYRDSYKKRDSGFAP